jgi:hypothetical protein
MAGGNTLMKLLIAVLALVSFGIFVPSMHADPTLSLGLGAGVALTSTVTTNGSGLEVFSWTYVDDATDILHNGSVLKTDNNVFSASFVYDPLGISVLNVTDVCANVAIITSNPTPCNLGFSFSDTSVGLGYLDGSNTPALLGNLDIALGADIGIGVGDGTLGLGHDGLILLNTDIGGGSGQIDFGQPPPSASPTPEPGTLSLMGTGLLGIAGVVRRKFRV